MLFRLALRRDPEALNELAEDVGAVLNGVTFVLFGAVLLGPALAGLTWQLALYAVLSLTLVRMLPVALAMWGSHARAPTLGFLGWFRSARAGVDRVRGDRGRGVQPSPRDANRPSDLRDRGLPCSPTGLTAAPLSALGGEGGQRFRRPSARREALEDRHARPLSCMEAAAPPLT
jgi:hypothetical protein